MDEKLQRIRHSCAHLLAEAVCERFGAEGPVLLAGGPATESGFYYDFALPRGVSPEDLVWLDARVKELAARRAAFVREEVSAAEAREIFAAQPFKLEILEGILARRVDADGEEAVAGGVPALSIYRHAGFQDLCSGPHVDDPAALDPAALKIAHVAGAYFRGDEKRPMLQRIYGFAAATAADLAQALERRAEAERRDHRKVGKDQELFFFHPTAPAMPYWLPRGLAILNELIAFWRKEHDLCGYDEIASPLVNEKSLWETSGHWEHYRDDMFVMELPNGQVYGLKPMNCPNAMLVFSHRQRSYRDLPLRLSDCDQLHRRERSGSLHGLLRVQKFQQDDAHVFCAPEQIESEIDAILDLVDRFYAIFGFRYEFRLSTRPREFLGEAADWDHAEAALARVLDRRLGAGNYPVARGEGAFYGPKIDILIHDALERPWQMGTIQLDYQLPKRFQCAYVDRDGAKKAPVVIHRVIYGSLERFLGVLLEHCGGALPLWLAPIQVRLVPVDEGQESRAEGVRRKLREAGIRVDVVGASASLGARIREASLLKIPYVAVVGAREAEAGAVSVRERGGKDRGAIGAAELVAEIVGRIREKARG